ncbi:NADH-quinone oxidoreductase subunit 12 [compost metagenome]
MTRLMALTFWGKSRVPKEVHPHESPALMTIPLIVLAVLSVIGGWIGIPHAIGEMLGHIPNVWEHWLHPVIKPIPGWVALDHTTEFTLMGVSVGLAIVSALVAYHFYVRAPEAPKKFAASIKPVYNLIYNKYFVDEAYFAGIVNPLVTLSRNTWYYVDVHFIDKCTYWAGDLIKGMGSLSRSLQTGNMQQYAMYIGLGVVAVLSFVIMR